MTVASGPEPSGGSAPSRRNSEGRAMATTVAMEQLAVSAIPTAAATSRSPHTTIATPKNVHPRADVRTRAGAPADASAAGRRAGPGSARGGRAPPPQRCARGRRLPM